MKTVVVLYSMFHGASEGNDSDFVINQRLFFDILIQFRQKINVLKAKLYFVLILWEKRLINHVVLVC